MTTTRVGINGFGSIGRRFFRQVAARQDVQVVAINDLGDPATFAHLLQYDSNYGRFDAEVRATDDALLVNGQEIRFTQEKDPAQLRWDEVQADIVVESTGVFTDGTAASQHLEGGARKVVISAPAKNVDATLVLGVNDDVYDPATHHVVSMASCTTNCLAPMAMVLHRRVGIEKGLMNTVHAYTNDQRVLDLPHKDPRRARAAAMNIIPTTTGAARAVGLVLPELDGKLNGFALRVPVPTVSVVDLVAELRRPVDPDEINGYFAEAAAGDLRGILALSQEPLVSSDYRGDTHSAVVDGLSTMTVGDTMVKVVAWYDNEWGYAARLLDLVVLLGERGVA